MGSGVASALRQPRFPSHRSQQEEGDPTGSPPAQRRASQMRRSTRTRRAHRVLGNTQACDVRTKPTLPPPPPRLHGARDPYEAQQ